MAERGLTGDATRDPIEGDRASPVTTAPREPGSRRALAWGLLAIAVIVAAAVAARWVMRADGTRPPSLLTFEKMGHLLALKMSYADVVDVTEDQDRSVAIPFTGSRITYGGTRVLLVVRGDCALGTDLRRASYGDVDAAHRRVTVVLSNPEVLHARVDHGPKGTSVYAITNQGVEALIPGDANRRKAIDSAMSIAQSKVEKACTGADAFAAAKANAEAVLVPSFTAIGWTASIVWQ